MNVETIESIDNAFMNVVELEHVSDLGLLVWLWLEINWIRSGNRTLIGHASAIMPARKGNEEVPPQPDCKVLELDRCICLDPVFNGGLREEVNLVRMLLIGRSLGIERCN